MELSLLSESSIHHLLIMSKNNCAHYQKSRGLIMVNLLLVCILFSGNESLNSVSVSTSHIVCPPFPLQTHIFVLVIVV